MTTRAHARTGWQALVVLVAMIVAAPVAAQSRTAASADDSVAILQPDAHLTVPAIPSGYQRVQRGNLRVSYPPAIGSQIADAVTNLDRDGYVVARQLGLTEPPAIDIRLVPDPSAMRALAPVELPPPAYAAGVAYPSMRLALVSATAPDSWQASDVRRVLRHELSHVMLEAATRPGAVPRWFSEGVAIHQAAEHSFERFRTLAWASFTGGLRPLRRLDSGFGGSNDEVNTAYAESADFVAWLLHSEGEARFPILLGHLHEGMSFEDAFRQTYRGSLLQLELEWRHDLSIRFLTAPLWAGSGLLWMLTIGLMGIAWIRRRRHSRATLARWEREEAMRPIAVTVFAPGIGSVIEQSPDASKLSVTDDEPIPLDSDRYSVH